MCKHFHNTLFKFLNSSNHKNFHRKFTIIASYTFLSEATFLSLYFSFIRNPSFNSALLSSIILLNAKLLVAYNNLLYHFLLEHISLHPLAYMHHMVYFPYHRIMRNLQLVLWHQINLIHH